MSETCNIPNQLNQEKEKTLHLPYLAIIPYAVRANKNICAESKILFGELAALSQKYGYCYATTTQLAEVKGISPRSILRYLTELEKEEFVVRKLENKRRKIFINKAQAHD